VLCRPFPFENPKANMLRKAENREALHSRTFPYVKIRHSFLLFKMAYQKTGTSGKNDVN
jgi:hypothetical protein